MKRLRGDAGRSTQPGRPPATSILPTPLRETVLAYLGSVFYGIDLAEKFVVTPFRRYAERITRVIGSQRPIRRARRRGH